MRRIICLLGAALVGLGMSGCTTVRYHDVKPLAQDFHKRSQESHTVVQRIQADIKAKRLLLHSLKRQGAEMKSQPYAQVSSLLPDFKTKPTHVKLNVKNKRTSKWTSKILPEGSCSSAQKAPNTNKSNGSKMRPKRGCPN